MSFAKFRETPRRAIPGMVVGPNQEYGTSFATERVPFSALLFQDDADEPGRHRTGKAGDTLDKLIGAARFSQLTERPYDDTVSPGYPKNYNFSHLRKGKMWMPADADLDGKTLHYQLADGDSRTKGYIYATASATSGLSLDISSIASVSKKEEGDDLALIEFFIR